MSPYYFPGLKQPTSQLFFDLQAFIAENGGRLRLAAKIENEWSKSYRTQIRDDNIQLFKHYSTKEILFIKENYEKMESIELARHLTRSVKSIRQKIYELQKQSELPYKILSYDRTHKILFKDLL